MRSLHSLCRFEGGSPELLAMDCRKDGKRHPLPLEMYGSHNIILRPAAAAHLEYSRCEPSSSEPERLPLIGEWERAFGFPTGHTYGPCHLTRGDGEPLKRLDVLARSPSPSALGPLLLALFSQPAGPALSDSFSIVDSAAQARLRMLQSTYTPPSSLPPAPPRVPEPPPPGDGPHPEDPAAGHSSGESPESDGGTPLREWWFLYAAEPGGGFIAVSSPPAPILL